MMLESLATVTSLALSDSADVHIREVLIHPMQYELQTTHHLDCQRQVVHERLVTEAEKLARGGRPLASFVRSILGWRVLRAVSVRGAA